jgi:uncharacterized protein (DUF486 family)
MSPAAGDVACAASCAGVQDSCQSVDCTGYAAHTPPVSLEFFRGAFVAMKAIVLLTISNLFMTAAWYGHLKYKDAPLGRVILVSWMIAFVEYCFQVPANRIGYGQFSAAQLKAIQEIITLVVFCLFSVFYLREELRWNVLLGFGFIVLASFFIFQNR